MWVRGNGQNGVEEVKLALWVRIGVEE